jgi:hypothetical protein
LPTLEEVSLPNGNKIILSLAKNRIEFFPVSGAFPAQ